MRNLDTISTWMSGHFFYDLDISARHTLLSTFLSRCFWDVGLNISCRDVEKCRDLNLLRFVISRHRCRDFSDVTMSGIIILDMDVVWDLFQKLLLQIIRKVIVIVCKTLLHWAELQFLLNNLLRCAPSPLPTFDKCLMSKIFDYINVKSQMKQHFYKVMLATKVCSMSFEKRYEINIFTWLRVIIETINYRKISSEKLSKSSNPFNAKILDVPITYPLFDLTT